MSQRDPKRNTEPTQETALTYEVGPDDESVSWLVGEDERPRRGGFHPDSAFPGVRRNRRRRPTLGFN
jgi:hypothetical protein